MLGFSPLGSSPLAYEGSSGGATYTLFGSPGVFVETGIDISAGSAHHYALTIGQGTFALAGVASQLQFDRVLRNTAGFFALTGDGQTEAAQYVMHLTAGAISLNGVAIGVTRPRRGVGADRGIFQVTAPTAKVARSRVMPLDIETFVTAGEPSGLIYYGFNLMLARGAFAASGGVATFFLTRKLLAAAGNIVLTGPANKAHFGRAILASAGAYAATGQAVTLDELYSIAPAAGTYNLVGDPIVAKAYRRMIDGVGAFTLTTPDDTILRSGRMLAADRGNFLVHTPDARLAQTRFLSLGTGAYALAGVPIAEHFTRRIAATAGSLHVQGVVAVEHLTRRVAALPGSYIIVGQAAALSTKYPPLAAADAAFTITGEALSFTHHRVMSLSPGAFAVFGFPMATGIDSDADLTAGDRWGISSYVSSTNRVVSSLSSVGQVDGIEAGAVST